MQFSWLVWSKWWYFSLAMRLQFTIEVIFCSAGEVTRPGVVAAVPRSRGRPREIVPSYHCSWYRENDWGLSVCLSVCLSACLSACLSFSEPVCLPVTGRISKYTNVDARLNIQLTLLQLHTFSVTRAWGKLEALSCSFCPKHWSFECSWSKNVLLLVQKQKTCAQNAKCILRWETPPTFCLPGYWRHSCDKIYQAFPFHFCILQMIKN